MSTNLFAKLSEIYKDYETKVERTGKFDYFILANPHWEENIKISEEDGIIFYFSYHHAHFDYGANMEENLQNLICYINDFLNESQVVFEVFIDDEAIRNFLLESGQN